MGGSSMIEESEPTTRMCTGCQQPHAVVRFRFRCRATGLRHRECNDCHAARMRVRNARLRRREFGRLTKELKEARDLAAVSAALRLMFRRLGGLEGFCAAWKQHMDDACALRPGGRVLANSYHAILNMARIVEESRALRFASATTEELEEALDQLVAEAIDRCLAEQFGLGDPEDAPDPAAAHPEGESDEDTDPP